ncbi:FAD-binding oxidoreductase [Aquicoccus sp.]|uniref:FAD-binding oxidoreductase n=1 Tax=Aquicoccus sp. TaxID=2055851 RepID=UPI00356892DD
MALCPAHRCPVTPFGIGSSLEGHVIPLRGGISIDTSRMNRVPAVHEADPDAWPNQPLLCSRSVTRAAASSQASPISSWLSRSAGFQPAKVTPRPPRMYLPVGFGRPTPSGGAAGGKASASRSLSFAITDICVTHSIGRPGG